MRSYRLQKLLTLLGFLVIASLAHAQYMVDCSGSTPGAYTSINSVVPLLMNGDMVLVTGTCTEDVSLNRLTGVYLGAPWGQTMNLLGSLSIGDSQALFIYGMNITSTSTHGIFVQYSHDISIDSCTSSNNAGNGLLVQGGSVVAVQNFGTFDNNASEGIHVEGNS